MFLIDKFIICSWTCSHKISIKNFGISQEHIKSFRDAYHAGFEKVKKGMLLDAEKDFRFEQRKLEEQCNADLIN